MPLLKEPKTVVSAAGVTQLASLRQRIEMLEAALSAARVERNAAIVELAAVLPERVVGQAAGVTGVYVHKLKKESAR